MMRILYCVSLFLFATTALADGLDASQKEALDKTTEMLRNSAQFNAAAKENPNAQKSADQLNAITLDPAQQQKMREISAGIFSDVAKTSGGSEEKIMEALQKAQSNPEAFAKSLTPEQQAQIRSLASEIEKKK